MAVETSSDIYQSDLMISSCVLKEFVGRSSPDMSSRSLFPCQYCEASGCCKLVFSGTHSELEIEKTA